MESLKYEKKMIDPYLKDYNVLNSSLSAAVSQVQTISGAIDAAINGYKPIVDEMSGSLDVWQGMVQKTTSEQFNAIVTSIAQLNNGILSLKDALTACGNYQKLLTELESKEKALIPIIEYINSEISKYNDLSNKISRTTDEVEKEKLKKERTIVENGISEYKITVYKDCMALREEAFNAVTKGRSDLEKGTSSITVSEDGMNYTVSGITSSGSNGTPGGGSNDTGGLNLINGFTPTGGLGANPGTNYSDSVAMPSANGNQGSSLNNELVTGTLTTIGASLNTSWNNVLNGLQVPQEAMKEYLTNFKANLNAGWNQAINDLNIQGSEYLTTIKTELNTGWNNLVNGLFIPQNEIKPEVTTNNPVPNSSSMTYEQIVTGALAGVNTVLNNLVNNLNQQQVLSDPASGKQETKPIPSSQKGDQFESPASSSSLITSSEKQGSIIKPTTEETHNSLVKMKEEPIDLTTKPASSSTLQSKGDQFESSVLSSSLITSSENQGSTPLDAPIFPEFSQAELDLKEKIANGDGYMTIELETPITNPSMNPSFVNAINENQELPSESLPPIIPEFSQAELDLKEKIANGDGYMTIELDSRQ